ncbi:MAG: MotA/TolQ/ExbB proton channel family protein [Opitutae bacterium]|mgnify:FL=1|jgi:biopolymer transport protein ExbB/TolQ
MDGGVGFDEPELSWSTQDIEQKIGFSGGRYTDTNAFFTFLVGLIMATLFFLVLEFLIGDSGTAAEWNENNKEMVSVVQEDGSTIQEEQVKPIPIHKAFADKFINRGIGGYLMGAGITLLFFWAVTILFIKGRKVSFQRKILALNLIPQDPNFFLNNATARDALLRIRGQVDDPKHFLLLNRIDVALSNLQNIGEISEVASLTNAQASIDEDQVSASYSLINGFNWAIPVLGFIGTVLGLGAAIGEFGVTIQLADDVDKLKNSLTDVTGGLSTAFDTTLLGLVASIVVQMLMTFRKRQEFLLLDECNEYCQTYVLAKLKLEKSGRGRG